MTYKDTEILILKYLNGETTAEEERLLALEVTRENVPDDWKIIAEMLGCLTVDVEQFKAFEGPKLHYGPQRHGDEPFVKAVDLLFERHIHEQSFRTVAFEGTIAPYAVYGQGNLMPFDVFSASFFLVSR